MRLKPILAAMLLATASTTTPAAAQSTLEVPANAGWKHAQTGIVLRSTLGGYARVDIRDSSQTELDVMATYGSTDRTTVTVYIFRPALSSVPVWFDRSETQILARDVYGNAAPQGQPLAFTPPGASATSGLRRVYLPSKGPFKATGLAIMPLGEWLVAIRVSSTELDTAALDAKMSDLIAAIGWPVQPAASPAAVPIAVCATNLSYSRSAKLKKPNMGSALLGGMLMGVISDTEKAKPETVTAAPALCRDGAATTQYGVYRRLDATDSYTMALGDAGITISVTPGIQLDKKDPGYRLTLGMLDKTMVYPDFDKLPSPDKAFEAVRTNRPVSSVAHGSKDITVTTQ